MQQRVIYVFYVQESSLSFAAVNEKALRVGCRTLFDVIYLPLNQQIGMCGGEGHAKIHSRFAQPDYLDTAV